MIAVTFTDQTLPARFGRPFKLRTLTKLKRAPALFVANRFLGGFWEDRDDNRVGGP